MTLTAAAASDSSFAGWSGAGCSGTGTCVVSMDAAKGVTASFTQNTFTLTVNSTGAAGVAIGASPASFAGTTNYNQTNIPFGTSFSLTAPTTSGSTKFIGWSGACVGNGLACSVVMNANQTVTASFGVVAAPGAPTLTRLIPGNGTLRVMFNPPASAGGGVITGYTARCTGANGTNRTTYAVTASTGTGGMANGSIAVSPDPATHGARRATSRAGPVRERAPCKPSAVPCWRTTRWPAHGHGGQFRQRAPAQAPVRPGNGARPTHRQPHLPVLRQCLSEEKLVQ